MEKGPKHVEVVRLLTKGAHGFVIFGGLGVAMPYLSSGLLAHKVHTLFETQKKLD